MGVFDGWETWREGDYAMTESVSIDLAAPDGFKRLEDRAYQDALAMLNTRFDDLAGVSLARLADELTDDLMQASVSLPKSAFADPEAAGRELLMIRYAYHHFVSVAVGIFAADLVRQFKAFPSGRQTQQQQQTPSPAQRAQHPRRK